MWYDADIDAVMTRTADRPVPAGRVRPGEALAFGLVLAGFSVVFLGLMVNVLAAGLLAFTIFFYAVVYTMWLKRWTPQNIVIGGAAGAFPPMIGWAAATGGIGLESILLFLIIFFWTPPHFWALSLYRVRRILPRRRADAAGGGGRRPRPGGRSCSIRWCWRRSARRPGCSATAGLAYGVVAIVGGAMMVALALAALSRAETTRAAAKQLFGVLDPLSVRAVRRAAGRARARPAQFGLPFGRVFA